MKVKLFRAVPKDPGARGAGRRYSTLVNNPQDFINVPDDVAMDIDALRDYLSHAHNAQPYICAEFAHGQYLWLETAAGRDETDLKKAKFALVSHLRGKEGWLVENGNAESRIVNLSGRDVSLASGVFYESRGELRAVVDGLPLSVGQRFPEMYLKSCDNIPAIVGRDDYVIVTLFFAWAHNKWRRRFNRFLVPHNPVYKDGMFVGYAGLLQP